MTTTLTTPRAPRGGLPPHDEAAEEAVLAALLLDDEAIHKVIGIVDPADFFRPQNAAIFEACIRLAERGEPLTVPTIAHYLNEEGELDESGGEAFLVELVSKYYTGIGVEAHGRIVARDAQYRRLINAAGEIAVLAYKGGPEPADVQGRAETILAGVATSAKTVHWETAADIVARLNNPEHVARRLIPTGLRPLDRMTGGLGLGELVALAAHTSHGKTAVSAQMTLNMAVNGTRVGYLAIEGSDEKIIERVTSMMAGTTLARAYRARDVDGYMAARALVATLPIYSVDRAHTPRTVSAVCAWITSLARGEGVEVFFLDHIDDMDLERQPGDSLATSYQLALRRLQNTAARENVSVVFLSQVNRASDESMPSMRSMRESGAKEELSQLVVMLWLDYRDEAIERASTYAGGDRARFLWAKVEKNTEGEIGDVRGPVPPPGEEPLPPFLLNLDTMTVEETHLGRRATPAVQTSLGLEPAGWEAPPWPD